MENLETKGFVLQINEYGKVVRQYHDVDYIRFMEVAKVMVASHLNNCLQQTGISKGRPEVKNATINFYTY